MASGHVNRANRPNTWPQPTSCIVKKTLASREPSTHGTSLPTDADKVRSAPESEAGNACCRVLHDLQPTAQIVSGVMIAAPIDSVTGRQYNHTHCVL
jgi:hypothetical protein